MALKVCAQGKHYYDHSTYDRCPICEEHSDSGSPMNAAAPPFNQAIPPATEKTEMIGGRGTTPVGGEPVDPTVEIGRGAGASVSESPHTGIVQKVRGGEDVTISSDFLPVAGWVVILEGPGKGHDFRLIQGNNRIGRDKEMEVCLSFGEESDETISRDTHAIIVYDNHANSFFIERGASRNLPTLNGSTVRRDSDLNKGDIVKLGNTSLLFIPLCGEDFSWS